MRDLKGRIHSFESCGTVDGPGIRFIVFMQGCPLRCSYCHNPDSWGTHQGNLYTVDEVFSEIEKYRSYMRSSNGGVTISGGEPLLQAKFVSALLKKCHAEGIHTAIDTSGAMPLSVSAEVLKLADLVLLDLKAIDSVIYKKITGASLAPVIETADFLNENNIRTWARHVLVPGLTDDDELLNKLAEFVAARANIELIEILPFHQYGLFKWQELKYEYTLADTAEPSKERIQNAVKIFEDHEVRTRY